MSESQPKYLTPPEIAKLLRVSDERVIGWIKRGELIGSNVGDGHERGRYRVAAENLEKFLSNRQPGKPSAGSRRPRKKKTENLVELY